MGKLLLLMLPGPALVSPWGLSESPAIWANLHKPGEVLSLVCNWRSGHWCWMWEICVLFLSPSTQVRWTSLWPLNRGLSTLLKTGFSLGCVLEKQWGVSAALAQYSHCSALLLSFSIHKALQCYSSSTSDMRHGITASQKGLGWKAP